MDKLSRNIELKAVLNDLLESLYFKDSWWNDENPLSARTFYLDYLDEETGIVYENLDWMILGAEEREILKRGTLDELTPVFEDALGLAHRYFDVYEKCFSLGLVSGDKHFFDDWLFLEDEIIIGFELEDEGKFTFIAQDKNNPVETHGISLHTEEGIKSMIGFLENEFFPDVTPGSGELRINPQGEEEYIEIRIDPVKHPKAYKARVEDFMRSGMTEEEAKEYASGPLEMELYFQPHQGVFMVEAEAVESTDIFSPYTQERYKSPLE